MIVLDGRKSGNIKCRWVGAQETQRRIKKFVTRFSGIHVD